MYVKVDIHALLLMGNFERKVMRMERTTAVHSRSTCRNIFMLCSKWSCAMQNNYQVHIFYCERSELLICRVHQFGLECISKTVPCRVLNVPGDMNNYTTTRHTENAFEKRRLPASACLFTLEYGVELSRTTVSRTMPIQPSQTPITSHDDSSLLSIS